MADAIPVDEYASAATPGMTIPAWVPRCLVAKAIALHSRETTSGRERDAALIERLTNDGRMERVWQELSKRKRIEHKQTEDFRYPIRPSAGSVPTTAIEAQSRAFLELFMVAFMDTLCWPWLPGNSVSHREMARNLCVHAESVQGGQPRSKRRQLARRFYDAAKAYEEWEVLEPLDHVHTVSVVINIAAFMNERFGSPMYGLTATVASVALGRDIRRQNVVDWYSRHRKK